jgi:GMP synthase (glutamine-hydrolysing)
MDGHAPLPRIVVVQQAPEEPLGALEPVLSAGAELMRIDWSHGLPEAEMDAMASVDALLEDPDYDGLVVLGGSMGAYDRQEYASIEYSLRLLSDALRREVPILGLGLGSQLLAESLGSRVYVGSNQGLPREVGFVPIYVTKVGAYDPVMRIFAVSDPQLFWHQDTHEVPVDAAHLAATAVYNMAAFRWGRWAYGLQFHAEASADMIEEWAREEGDLLAAQGVDCDRLIAQAWMFDDAIRERADRLAALFLEWARERCPRL